MKSSQLRQAAAAEVKKHRKVVFSAFLILTIVSYAPAYYGGIATSIGETAIMMLWILSELACAAYIIATTKGYAKFSLKAATGGVPSIRDLFVGVKDVWRSFLALLLIAVRVFLWSLLFIVPGIIAHYRYILTFYVMNDNPDFTITQCLKESERLMEGNKLKLFVIVLYYIIMAIIFSLLLELILLLLMLVVSIPLVYLLDSSSVTLALCYFVAGFSSVLIAFSIMLLKINTVTARFYYEIVNADRREQVGQVI
ncbi:MAG: DUF975 family protein [Negativicutes bacterium]